MKETADGTCLCARCARHERRWAAIRRIDTLTQQIVVWAVVSAAALALLAITFCGVLLAIGPATDPTASHLPRDFAASFVVWGLGLQFARRIIW